MSCCKRPYRAHEDYCGSKFQYRLAQLADAADYLTVPVKLLIWLGVAVLIWNLVSYALFPTEYLILPI